MPWIPQVPLQSSSEFDGLGLFLVSSAADRRIRHRIFGVKVNKLLHCFGCETVSTDPVEFILMYIETRYNRHIPEILRGYVWRISWTGAYPAAQETYIRHCTCFVPHVRKSLSQHGVFWCLRFLVHVFAQYYHCGSLMPYSFSQCSLLCFLVRSIPVSGLYKAAFSPPIMGGSCAKSPANITLIPPNGKSGLFVHIAILALILYRSLHDNMDYFVKEHIFYPPPAWL